MEGKVRIDHGLYRFNEPYGVVKRNPIKRIDILPFKKLLDKVSVFNDYANLIFTLGTYEDEKYRIQAISIVCPRDNFSRNYGWEAVHERIRETLEKLEFKNKNPTVVVVGK